MRTNFLIFLAFLIMAVNLPVLEPPIIAQNNDCVPTAEEYRDGADSAGSCTNVWKEVYWEVTFLTYGLNELFLKGVELEYVMRKILVVTPLHFRPYAGLIFSHLKLFRDNGNKMFIQPLWLLKM